MKIALTGVNGRVGRKIAGGALKDGHSVVGIDYADPNPEHEPHENFTFIKADLQDYQAALNAFKGCEAIIALAALPNPGDYLVATHNTNAVVSWNVLRAAAELGITRVAQASSVNVLGGYYNEKVHFDYFPVDEEHPCRPDEPYGLSKQIMELQADAITRRYKFMRVASLRLHWFIDPSWIDRVYNMPQEEAHKHLWGYTFESAGIRAFLLAVTAGDFTGHERFFVIAPKIGSRIKTSELIGEFFPNAEIKKELAHDEAAINSSKAERFFGWRHDDDDHGGTEAAPAAAAAKTEEVVAAPAEKTEEVKAVEEQADKPEEQVNGHAGHVEAEETVESALPEKVEEEAVVVPHETVHANGSAAVEPEAVADNLIDKKDIVVIDVEPIGHSACACCEESIVHAVSVEPEAIAAN
ncbi:NAD(P)-binding protein [Sistotremastrum suecicum HHB10207 ss-3]|uniref:NAD(P)-binding protein n=1 Tax=Sistotremastrum suecicum HHB10207 ss-3 TaxID=1314776 RepID=A0A166G2I6_9AGAM|nr:NAD(P)-binding protein [Sistotremastrum suecicum HHB10207 ss-3]